MPLQSQPRAIILDMDGVLFHGEHVLPGAVDFLHNIAATPHLFLTNNPILLAEQVVQKFARIGLPEITAEMVLTSGEATARYLHNIHPGYSYFAVGADGLHRMLARYGTENSLDPDFVVIGEGPGLNYHSLQMGVNFVLKQGARLISTNPDLTVDAVEDGRHRVLPGGGALVAPFEAATGRKAVVIGKPNPLMFEMAIRQLGVAASECVMIGDRPDTDIAGATMIGMQTAMVRTGRFAVGESWPSELAAPDWDVSSLAELYNCWS